MKARIQYGRRRLRYAGTDPPREGPCLRIPSKEGGTMT